MGQLRAGATDASSDILAALGALAECSAQLEHEPLKGTMGQATVSLLAHIEGRCRESVEFLLRGLGASGELADVQFDKLWTLHVMGKRSEATKRWILELGGAGAIAAAMAACPTHEQLMQEGIWFIYDLGGLAGVAELLRHSSTAVAAAAAWVIYDLAAKDGSDDWPEAGSILLLLLEVLRNCPPSVTPEHSEVRWSCISAARRLVARQPGRGRLFLSNGGGEVVVATLCAASGAGRLGDNLLVSAAQLVGTLADGSDQAVQQLRQVGVLEALVRYGLAVLGSATQDVMWALGQLGGVSVVVEAMKHTASSLSSIQGGLAVLSEIAWNPSDEIKEHYLEAAAPLLSLARCCETDGAPAEDLARSLKGLGGVIHGLAPHIVPGAWQVADDSMALLMGAMSPNRDEAIVQAAAETLGRIAVDAPAWRRTLRQGISVLTERLRTPTEGGRRLQKYLFWAAAAIAGLPAVLQEMRLQQRSPTVQDAAICSIIDILDDNLEGDFALSGTEEASDARQGAYAPEAIAVVVEAMRLHRSFVPVQFRGAYSLGLLHGLLPIGAPVPEEAIDAVLNALWRHPLDLNVTGGVCSALRSFLEPRSGRDSQGGAAVSGGVVARVAEGLRARDAEPGLCQALENFADKAEEEGLKLLEDAAYALGLVSGVPSVVQILAASETSAGALRASGLKALFELGRCFPELVAPSVADVVAVTEMLASGNGPCELEIRRHAELLRGMLYSMAQQRPQ